MHRDCVYRCVACGATIDAATPDLVDAARWRRLSASSGTEHEPADALCPPCQACSRVRRHADSDD